MNRFEQALGRATLQRMGGIILVDDGEDIWLAEAAEFDALRRRLEAEPPTDARLAYDSLRASLQNVASVHGRCRGYWRRIVSEACALGLLDDLAESFTTSAP